MEVLEFVKEHWMTISMVMVVLISILNAATRHFSEHKGLVKVLSFISEMLSILTSRGVAAPKIKLPGVSKPPKE